jgi:purine-binding chemotaxis protein CheW
MPEISLPEVDQGELLLTFQLGEAHYGLEAIRVQEVMLVGAITPVHHAPDYVRGIINLRGKIVTVIDLGIKLLDEEINIGEFSRILIADWMDEYVGLLVDRVGDVISPDRDLIEAQPANVAEEQGRFIQGVFRDGEQPVVAVIHLAELLA